MLLTFKRFAAQLIRVAIMAERRVAQIAGHLFPKGMLAGQVRSRFALYPYRKYSINSLNHRSPSSQAQVKALVQKQPKCLLKKEQK